MLDSGFLMPEANFRIAKYVNGDEQFSRSLTIMDTSAYTYLYAINDPHQFHGAPKPSANGRGNQYFIAGNARSSHRKRAAPSSPLADESDLFETSREQKGLESMARGVAATRIYAKRRHSR